MNESINPGILKTDVKAPKVDAKVTARLDELGADALTEDGLKGFMEPKKGRGRPKGARTKKDTVAVPLDANPALQQQNIEQLKQLLLPVVQIISGLGERLAESPDAAMSKLEMDTITTAAAGCINKYMPNVVGEHAELILLTLASSAWSYRVYALRQNKLAELIAERKERDLRNGKVEPSIVSQVN